MYQATILGRVPLERSRLGKNFIVYIELHFRGELANLEFETLHVVSSLMKLELRRDGRVVFSTVMDYLSDSDDDADRFLEKYGVKKLMFLDFLMVTLRVLVENAPPGQDILFRITADINEIFADSIAEIMNS